MINWIRTSEQLPPRDKTWVLVAFKEDRNPDGYLYGCWGGYLVCEDPDSVDYWAYVNKPEEFDE